jgi:arsenite methyltransferase
MAGVSLNLDTADLAQRYEQISADRQFRGGKELLRELVLVPGETVLDIGCGTGMLAEYAASLIGLRGSVTGIDPLPLRIEIAKKRIAANLSFKLGNAYDLGVAADSFDLVYMNAVFHWLPEKSAPLRAVLYALKPGGRFGLTTVSPERDRNWLNVIRQRVLAREPYSKFPEAQGVQNYRVSCGELEKLLLENGFAIAKLETRVSVRNAAARGQWTVEGALDFAEASSFGNFLGHLPQELQAPAREEIKRELESLRGRRKSEDVAREDIPRAGRIVAIATKP